MSSAMDEGPGLGQEVTESSSHLDHYQNPLDYVRSLLTKNICISLSHSRQIDGTLQFFDTHLNLIVSDASELTTKEIFDTTSNQMVYQKTKRVLPLLCIRGDQIISLGMQNLPGT
ncbi:MAG: U4/U6-U5 snRNP complex subunit lsm3 [Marteilia pararefringens]